MLCPSCGAKTKVTHSRPYQAHHKHRATRMWAAVNKAVGDFTDDWVARTRFCPECSWKGFSIELYLQDLNHGWRRKRSRS